MRDVLEDAVRQELRRVDGRWPAHASTLAALVRQGLLERSERVSRHGDALTVWTATDAGRDALKPKERVYVERPVFLGRGSSELPDKDENTDLEAKGYTSDPRRRIDPLEVVGEVSVVWQRRTEVKRIQAQDRKARARQAAEKARYAA
jgi:putative ubiquitin-RnfH superfamily antitoxin RatB of RatAB toxin-antitoxin module